MYYSPFRYPGGKRRLANYIKLIFRDNDLIEGEYAEVYAGGAAVALELLFQEYVARIHINDLDCGIHAFWWAAKNETDLLCRSIQDVPLSMEEWERQRAVLRSEDPDCIDLAIATFYLNRTNRSGIITGGVIGGKDQSGKYKMDARFNKSDLVRRIEKIGRYRTRIKVYNLDGAVFLRNIAPNLPSRSLIYLDPPYFVKGKQALYANYYNEDDHEEVSRLVGDLNCSWIVSYDDVGSIRKLYDQYRLFSYGINYTAQDKYRGREVIFFSENLSIPDVTNPVKVKNREVQQLTLV